MEQSTAHDRCVMDRLGAVAVGGSAWRCAGGCRADRGADVACGRCAIWMPRAAHRRRRRHPAVGALPRRHRRRARARRSPTPSAYAAEPGDFTSRSASVGRDDDRELSRPSTESSPGGLRARRSAPRRPAAGEPMARSASSPRAAARQSTTTNTRNANHSPTPTATRRTTTVLRFDRSRAAPLDPSVPRSETPRRRRL
jgi:hypothetical protein